MRMPSPMSTSRGRGPSCWPGPDSRGSGRRRALTELTDAGWRRCSTPPAAPASAPRSSRSAATAARELSPGSDLDLLLLVPGTATTAQARPRSRPAVWYPVWDAGLRLDHSCARSRRGAPRRQRRPAGPARDARPAARRRRRVAQRDACGEAVLADWRGFARRRLPELFAAARASGPSASGDLAFSLEPDLKESRGGLRDLIALRAVAASWVADVRHDGLDDARQRAARRARRPARR